MLTLVLVLLYCLCCTGAGYLALRLLAWRAWQEMDTSTNAFLATAFLIGQAVMASVWMLLAIPSWLNPYVVLGLLLMSASGLYYARQAFIHLPQRLKREFDGLREEDPGLKLLAAMALALFVLFALAAFLMPPIGDAEAFYIAYPKIIADSQRLIPMPGLYAPFSSIGFSGEMHFAALIMLDGVRAAKLFVWPVALAAAVMLTAIAKDAGLKRCGQWLAFIMLLTSTSFTIHIWDGKIDLFAAALGLAAYHWSLHTGPATTQGIALRITGLLAGFAAVSKFSYIPALIPGLLMLVAWQQYLSVAGNERRMVLTVRRAFFAWVQFGLFAAIAIIPHLTKNAILFGDALTPFTTPSLSKSFIEQVWFTPETTRWIIMTYPFALVFGRYQMQEGNLSFLLLAFLPLALFLPRTKTLWHSRLAQITAAALLGTMIWVILRPSVIAPRYILATLLLFIPLAARAAEHVYKTETKPRWLSASILASLLIALLIFFSYPRLKLPGYFVKYMKGEFTECDLASPYCAPFTALNRQAAPGERIYLAAYYGYWLRSDLLQCRDNAEDVKIINASETPESRWARLYERGIRYLIVDKTSHAPTLELFDPSKAPGWLEITKFSESPMMVIYQVRSRDPGQKPAASCKQTSPPAWDIVELI